MCKKNRIEQKIENKYIIIKDEIQNCENMTIVWN